MEICRKLTSEDLSGVTACRAVGILSANPGEGASTTALAIADSLSSLHSASVLLVETDFDRPSAAANLGLAKAPGVAELMQKPDTPLNSLIQRTEGSFDAIPAGRQSRAGLPIKAENFGAIFSSLKSLYDYVLFDLGAANASPLATTIAAKLDGVIMVLACEETRWESAQSLQSRLRAANANILGVVLNKRRYYIPRFLYSRF